MQNYVGGGSNTEIVQTRTDGGGQCSLLPRLNVKMPVQTLQEEDIKTENGEKINIKNFFLCKKVTRLFILTKSLAKRPQEVHRSPEGQVRAQAWGGALTPETPSSLLGPTLMPASPDWSQIKDWTRPPRG